MEDQLWNFTCQKCRENRERPTVIIMGMTRYRRFKDLLLRTYIDHSQYFDQATGRITWENISILRTPDLDEEGIKMF